MSVDDPRADALYGLPPERFVAERDALAKSLRAAGDREGADEVRRLPKPTRAAWAVNVAARDHPDAARALAEAARLLSDVQRELLAGGHPAALREASEGARSAVEALVAVAPESGAATIDKVRATLQAAVVDPDVLAQVAAARVVREQVASGFGGLTAAAAGKSATARSRSGKAQREAKPDAKPAAPHRGPPLTGATAAAPRDGPRGPSRATRSEASERERRRANQQEEQRAREARDAARRREKLRRAKEEEAAAEHETTAARRALEQVESALAERRAQLRDAEARVKDAKRRRERAER